MSTSPFIEAELVMNADGELTVFLTKDGKYDQSIAHLSGATLRNLDLFNEEREGFGWIKDIHRIQTLLIWQLTDRGYYVANDDSLSNAITALCLPGPPRGENHYMFRLTRV